MAFQLSFSQLTGLVNVLHQDKQLRKPCGSFRDSASGGCCSLRGFRQVHGFIYIVIFLSATCSILCSASLLNFCRVALQCYRIYSSISHSFYALIFLGVLSLDNCELHSLQKPLVEASPSSHLPLVAGDFVGGGMSNQLTPALSSAAGLLSGLERVTLQPGASVSPSDRWEKQHKASWVKQSETLMNTAIRNGFLNITDDPPPGTATHSLPAPAFPMPYCSGVSLTALEIPMPP